MKLHEIREAKAAKIHAMREMVNVADVEKRDLSDTEKSKFDKLKSEIAALDGDEERAAYIESIERRSTGERIQDRTFSQLEADVSLLAVLQAQTEQRALTGAAAEYNQEMERRNGRKAQGVYLPFRALEKRVNTTTTAAGIVGTQHRSDQYIEPLRNELLARKLGVRVLTGLTSDVAIPKHGTGVTSGWVSENEALTASDIALSNVNLKPKHVGALSEMSRQLIQQSSPDIEDLLRADLSYAIAKEIDTALIKGAGIKDPKGILNTAGIQTQSLATLDWVGINAMLEKLELANAHSMGASWLMNPTVKTKLKTTLKAAGIAGYMLENGKIDEYAAYSTNQTPASTLILGDWSQVLLGIWSELDILVNPYAEPAYSKGNVLIRAMATCDIAVRHPEAFVVADDIA